MQTLDHGRAETEGLLRTGDEVVYDPQYEIKLLESIACFNSGTFILVSNQNSRFGLAVTPLDSSLAISGSLHQLRLLVYRFARDALVLNIGVAKRKTATLLFFVSR
jgi:hypothetical protein